MMSRDNWLILGLALLAGIAGGWLQHASRQRHERSALIGRPLPALVLNDLAGQRHALGEYRGRRVLLNLWASWCGPCRREMPALVDAERRFGPRGASVVGIAMDDPAAVRAYLAAHPLDYPTLLGQLGSPSTAVQLGDQAQVLPYSVLLDEHGRVLAAHAGSLVPAQLDDWLEPADTDR